ncbi:hypothetical protein LCGC14_1894150 [marine sediment metagenome]|uniref:Uncharacterized protein n=1 Tax=marine sediment metagenome TaxID=412755 RepID=A0A0F9GLW0_9ZZZZ
MITRDQRIIEAIDRLSLGVITSGNKITIVNSISKTMGEKVTHQEIVIALVGTLEDTYEDDMFCSCEECGKTFHRCQFCGELYCRYCAHGCYCPSNVADTEYLESEKFREW